MVKTTDAIPFLSPAELKNGQQLTIGPESSHSIQSFQTQDGKTRTRVVIGFNEFPKCAVLNGTTRKKLERVWGLDTAAWVGKKVEVIIAQQMIQGNLTDVLYLVPVDVKQEPRKK